MQPKKDQQPANSFSATHQNACITRRFISMQPGNNQGKFIQCVSPTTNDSCSIDGKNLDLTNRTAMLNNIPSPVSQMCNPSTIRDNCEVSVRSHVGEIQFIEYEEFEVVKQPSTKRNRILEEVDDNVATSTVEILAHIEDCPGENAQAITDRNCLTERSEGPLQSRRSSKRRLLFDSCEIEAPRCSLKSNSKSIAEAESKCSENNKRKRDYFEMPLQESQSKYNLENISSSVCSKERSTQKDEAARKDSIQENCDSKPDSEVFRFRYRAGSKPTEDSVIIDLRDKILQKDKEIDRLQQLAKNNRKEGSPTSPYKNIKEEKQFLAELNQELREKLSEAHFRAQQLEHESQILKIEIAEQRENVSKIEDRKAKIEAMEFALQNEIRSKDNEIYHLLEQQKTLQTKKIKLKSISKQKDEIIEDLKNQIEQLTRLNQNELYLSLAEKTKIYKEKIEQLTDQLETQKVIAKQKESAIDNLLLKLDALAGANQEKSNQIFVLKSEIKGLKEQVERFKKEIKNPSTAFHSHKSSIDTMAMSHNVSREQDFRGIVPKYEIVDTKSRDAQIKKRNSDNFGNEKAGLSSTLGRGVFSSTEWTGKSLDENTRSLNQNDSRDSESSNINMRGRPSDAEEASVKPPIQKLQHKSSETNLRDAIANADKHEIKNIQDLQKRLNNLKSKRLEFEKRKHYALGISSKDESMEKKKEEKMSSTQVFTNLKAFSSIIPESTSSPAVAANRRKQIAVKDKENLMNALNTRFQTEEAPKGAKEPLSKTQLPFTDESNSRQSSQTRPPKGEQNINFNKTDYVNIRDIRAVNRFLNPNANSLVLKQGSLSVPYAKGHKKSYDANVKSSPSKIGGVKTRIERNRTSSRPKEIPEYLTKTSLTPSGQNKIFDKLLGQKIRK